MTLATFASVAELGSFLQDSTLDQGSAQLALESATGQIQGATGQTFFKVTGDTVTLPGYKRNILLPQRPVSDVTAISLTDWGFTDYPAAYGSWRLTNGVLEWRGDIGVQYPESDGGVGRSMWPRLVTVTYDHGYDVIPSDVKDVCLRLAAERFSNPEGLDSERIDDYQYRRTGRVQPGQRNYDDLAALVRRYRANAISVAVR